MTEAAATTMVEVQNRGLQAMGIQAPVPEMSEHHPHGVLPLWGGGSLCAGVYV